MFDSFADFDLIRVGVIVVALIVSGMVKGLLGLGLPLAALPILLLMMDIRTAVPLLAVAMVTTNVLQAMEGRSPIPALRRHWLAAVCIVVGTLIGVRLLISVPTRALNACVGIMMIGTAILLFARPKLRIPPPRERLVGAAAGFSAGVLGGIAGLFGPLLTMFMISIDLDRDAFVREQAMLFAVATTTFFISLLASGLLNLSNLPLSALAALPAHAGMWIGQNLRSSIQPDRFRSAVLLLVAISGAHLLQKAL